MISRIFLRGPGGSGKTYMLTRVILPVYEHFLPRASKGVAAQNSAARLIAGATLHYMSALTRSQDLSLQKPSRARLEALQRRWLHVGLVFVDEISLTPPALLAAMQRNGADTLCRTPSLVVQCVKGVRKGKRHVPAVGKGQQVIMWRRWEMSCAKSLQVIFCN